MPGVEWKDEYNVGCDYVDQAHRKLFSILQKTELLCKDEDYEKNRFACIESIKFLKNYTMTHFAQEEGFMRERGYAGYEIHKRLHDELRMETIPALEDKLSESNYAREVVAEFLGVFAGWLMSHILIEDQAITGKVASRYSVSKGKDEEAILQQEIEHVLTGFTGSDVKVADKSYAGQEIRNAFYYQMEYGSIRLIFIAQNSLIFDMVETILGFRVEKINRDVLITYVNMVHNFAGQAVSLYSPIEQGKKSTKSAIKPEQLAAFFQEETALYHTKWETPCGEFALCVFEKI